MRENIIVLAEYDPEESCCLCQQMEEAGLRVAAVVESGREIADKVRETGADTVVMDLLLKHQDGITALKELRRQFGRELKIIVFCSYFSHIFLAEIWQLGADGIISKPFQTEELMQALSGLGWADRQETGSPGDQIKDLLLMLEIRPGSRCGTYLQKSLEILLEEPEELTNVTKRLYPRVAKLTDSSRNAVERSIRFCIRQLWQRETSWLRNRIRAEHIYDQSTAPGNSAFLALLLRELQRQQRQLLQERA